MGARSVRATVRGRPAHAEPSRRAFAGGGRGFRGRGIVAARPFRRLFQRRIDQPEPHCVDRARHGSRFGSDQRAGAGVRQAASSRAGRGGEINNQSSLRARPASAETAGICAALSNVLPGDRRPRTQGSRARDRCAARTHSHACRGAGSSGATRLSLPRPQAAAACHTGACAPGAANRGRRGRIASDVIGARPQLL